MCNRYGKSLAFAFLSTNLFITAAIFGATSARRINGMKEQTQFGSHVIYVSPLPGSEYLTPSTNIIVRSDEVLSPSAISNSLFKIVGSLSGVHMGKVILASGQETLLFQPEASFALGEVVTVSMTRPLLSATGDTVSLSSFSFTISRVDLNTDKAAISQFAQAMPNGSITTGVFPTPHGGPLFTPNRAQSSRPVVMSNQDDSLPSDFPPLTVTASDSPTKGYIFLATNIQDMYYGNYLIIADNNGNPVFYRNVGSSPALDFTVQPTGVLTYFIANTHVYYVMNTSFQVIDSITAGNGYISDDHELQLLPDGNIFLLADDYEQVDMSKIVPDGTPQATVLDVVVQELDKNKNVIFQWRTIDHFNITDTQGQNLTAANVDPFHCNAISVDPDGNILLSTRHLSEITKIDVGTGDIIWRLGGNNNQFTFVNDSIGFTWQHDIRRLANGDITLMDNANLSTPDYSRAVEYQLDEVNKIATLVWQFRHTPDVYNEYMGNVQRLPDGNTIIGWGGAHTPAVTEVMPGGGTAFEMTFPYDDAVILSYRAFRFPFLFLTSPTAIDTIQPGDITTLRWMSSGVGIVDVDYSTDVGSSWSNVTVNYPANNDSISVPVPTNARVSLQFRVVQSGAVGRGTTYYSDTLAVAQATNSIAPTGTAYSYALSNNYPNPFNPSTTIGYEIAAQGHVTLKVYNILGQQVAALVDAVQAPGMYNVKLDGTRLASGVYFYRLSTSSGFVQVKKMILEK